MKKTRRLLVGAAAAAILAPVLAEQAADPNAAEAKALIKELYTA